MPNIDSPAKHKTPNYKQVRRTWTGQNIFGDPKTFVAYVWEKQPLRASRKDNIKHS